MISLTADGTTLLMEVGAFIEPVEVYDTSGKLLGLFIPANLERGKELAARAGAGIDWAEVARRVQSGEPEQPTAAVLQRLGVLRAEVERRSQVDEKAMTTDEAVALVGRLRSQPSTGTLPSASVGVGGERCPIP